jgi:translation initiation factor IF-2
MRERGSQVTYLIILVVAANDGVKPQTIESIRHIKSSGVPFVVAINKTDITGVDTNVVKSELVEQGITVTEYGGEIDAIEISALKGTNVDKLLETLLVMAELAELTADPDAPLEAVVIESSKSRQKGNVASVIVQQGTLSVRQSLEVDGITGRVKSLYDEVGRQLNNVLPGYPAEIMSFSEVPPVGGVVHDQDSDYTLVVDPKAEIAGPVDADADWSDLDFSQMIEAEGKTKIQLLIKADVEGTLEAILQSLDEESTQLVGSGVGEVTEGDLDMAEAYNALIIAFQVAIPTKIKKIAKDRKIRIKKYEIIYQLIEDLQKRMLKLLEPTIDEIVVGEGEILQVFEIRGEKIAGVRVKTGEFNKNDHYHIKREDQIIADPVLKSMQRGKEEVTRVTAKSEAGLTFKNKKLDFAPGDIIVAYKVEDDLIED